MDSVSSAVDTVMSALNSVAGGAMKGFEVNAVIFDFDWDASINLNAHQSKSLAEMHGSAGVKITYTVNKKQTTVGLTVSLSVSSSLVERYAEVSLLWWR